MRKRELFKVEGNKIVRLRRHCPKCGEGVFLAEHKGRLSCGACGYTEFKSGDRKIPERPVEKEEPVMEVEKPEEPAPSPPAEQIVQEQETKAEPLQEEPSESVKQDEEPREEKMDAAEEPAEEEKPAEESPKKEEVSEVKQEIKPVEESKKSKQKSEENKK